MSIKKLSIQERDKIFECQIMNDTKYNNFNNSACEVCNAIDICIKNNVYEYIREKDKRYYKKRLAKLETEKANIERALSILDKYTTNKVAQI